jgi:hypothetical protein
VIWLLGAALFGSESDHHYGFGNTNRRQRQHRSVGSDFTSALTSSGWWRGPDTDHATRPGKKHGWLW